MATCWTKALEDLLAGPVPTANFAAEFEAWKSSGAAGEYDNYLFGKDGAYRAPIGTLRHVHLVPLRDVSALAEWNKRWRFRSRKVSNRVLVYVTDATHGNLLIYILDEPTAHEVPKLQTPAHRALIRKFIAVGDAFIQTGAVIA